MDKIQLSVIVPLYNEADNIKPLYDAISSTLDAKDFTYEIIFVDDGSTDNTVSEARKLASLDTRLRIIKFRRNYGQTPAMAAGIDNARGSILITMDGDLQNDPDDIPRFLEKIDEGFDIVVGWRHKRQDKLITRKIPSIIANRLIGKITGVPIKDNGCSLKAYKANVIKNIPLYSEMHRFIPAMSSLAGTKIAEIKVKHHARKFGESKYGLSRIYKVLLDLIAIKTILSFFFRPMQLFAAVSSISAAIGLIPLAFLFKGESGGSELIIFGVAFMYFSLAAILLLWGVLGELVFNTGDTKPEFFALIKKSPQNRT